MKITKHIKRKITFHTTHILPSLIAVSLLLAACASPTTPQPTATLLLPTPTVTPTPIPPTPTLSPEQQQKIIVENKIKRHLAALGLTTCENCTIKNLPDNSTEALVQKVIDKDGKEQEIILSAIGADGKETPYKTWKMQSQKIVGTIVDGAKVVDGSGKTSYNWDAAKQVWVVERKIVFKKDFYTSKEALSIATAPDSREAYDSINSSSSFVKGIFVTNDGYVRYFAESRFPFVLVKTVVEEKDDGGKIAYLLYYHKKTSKNDPFLFRVIVPFEQIVSGIAGLAGVDKPALGGWRNYDSLSLVPSDKRVEVFQKARVASDPLGVFSRLMISAPKTTGNEGSLTNTSADINFFSSGYKDFSSRGKSNYKNYEEFNRALEETWQRAYAQYQALNLSDPLTMEMELGDDWYASEKIVDMQFPDGLYVEPFVNPAQR